MITKKVKVGDFSIASLFEIEELPSRKYVINTINAYSWVMTDSIPIFKEALQGSDVLLPDGVGVVFAAKLLAGVDIKKIAGADLHLMLLNALERKQGRCFYLGSSDKTLALIKQRLKAEFPSISVEAYSPPYKAEFSDDDNELMLSKIREFSPDVVFVGMTAPKQETWIHLNHDKINTSVICGIGAVFDFYAGMKERPSKWMIDHNLEWFGRLISEPRRMWKRYLVYNCVFIYRILKLYIKMPRKKS